jgi:hypothetical protein
MQPYGPPGHNLCSSRRAEWPTPQRRCVGGSDRWPRAVSYSRCKATPRTDGPFSINPAASTRIGRGEGFPTVVEPVAHPPELGGGVAGPVIVRRDEIETAAGHIGNLGGTPRAIVESRSGSAAVGVGSDLVGVGARHRSCGPSAQFPRWNSEIRRERLSPRYQQKCQQNGWLQ